MIFEKERSEVVFYLKKMSREGLTSGTSGNMSVLLREAGYILISPSGMAYESLEASDIVVMDAKGRVVEGRRTPSSEMELHMALYRAKEEAAAVVHTHSKYCTVFACLNMPIRALHYVLADTGATEIPVAPYRLYGSKDLANEAVRTMGSSGACLLANHGFVSCSATLKAAYDAARSAEWVAELYWKCLCISKPNILSDDEMNEVMKKFASYGQKPSESSSEK